MSTAASFHDDLDGVFARSSSPRLGEGVVPLDTPGTGSLTTSGSEETFAYPRRYDGAELKMVERLTADFYWVGATMLLGRYCLARYNGGDRQPSVFSALPVVCKQSRLPSWVWKSWQR